MKFLKDQVFTQEANHQVTAVIDQGCEFEGKLCFHGTVRISGIFRGEIYTPDILIIGEGAQVKGKIEAGIIIISGEVNGELLAKKRVEIHPPAVFSGEIITPSLSVDEGVIFEGKSKMLQSIPSPEESTSYNKMGLP